MARRIIIIGEDNPTSGGQRLALYPRPANRTGGRLAAMMGLSCSEYLRLTIRANLCPGGRWDASQARLMADTLMHVLCYHRHKAEPQPHVILVGLKVARAVLVRAPLATCEWQQVSCAGWVATVALLPHPSGRNRWYNSEANRSRAAGFLRLAVEEICCPGRK